MNLQDPKMWTEEHWALFETLEDIRRNKFNSDYHDFKQHMLYILEVMDKMYLELPNEISSLWKEENNGS